MHIWHLVKHFSICPHLGHFESGGDSPRKGLRSILRLFLMPLTATGREDQPIALVWIRSEVMLNCNLGWMSTKSIPNDIWPLNSTIPGLLDFSAQECIWVRGEYRNNFIAAELILLILKSPNPG